MAEVYNTPTIINEAYFKQFAPIPRNYNIDDIRPYFSIAENIWVVPIIGEDLYNELLEQVTNNEVTDVNSTLLLNIYPYLSICICYESLPLISYHLTEVGITKGKSDNSDSVSINDVNYISKHFRAQIEALKSQLKAFLKRNAEYFPLLTNDYSNCDCENTCIDDWQFDYFERGIYNRYELLDSLNHFLNKKDRPNSYRQLYGVPKQKIDIH